MDPAGCICNEIEVKVEELEDILRHVLLQVDQVVLMVGVIVELLENNI